MAEFVDYNGLKKFLQKMRGEFLTQESANLIYVKKTDAGNTQSESGDYNQSEIEKLIQNALEKEDWQEDGENFIYGKLYRNNVSPYIKLGGVNSAENIQVKEKSVTIPASNFDSETQITIESSGYSYSFGKSFNVKLEGKNTTLENSGGNDIISNFNLSSDTLKLKNAAATLTDTVENGNTTLSLSEGGTILLEGVESGTIKILLGKYPTEYEIGVGMPTDFAINTETNATLSTIESGKTRWINIADDVSISQDNFVAENYGGNVTITGSSVGDSIFNYSENVTIESGAGNDFITNSGDNVSIEAGEGNDSIISSGQNVSINGGDGADYISLDGAIKNVISLGAGNDSLIAYNGANNNTIYGGEASDYVSLDGVSSNVVSTGAGTVSTKLYNNAADNTVYGGSNYDYITLNGASANVISVGAGNSYVYINNDSANNTIYAEGTNYIYSSVGGNTYTFTEKSCFNIYGYNENDSVIVPDNATVSGLYQNDYYRIYASSGGYANLHNYGGKLQIFDTAGNKVSIGTEDDGEYFTPVSVQTNAKASQKITLTAPTFFTNTGSRTSITGSYFQDTISNSADYVSIQAKASTSYSASTDSISNSGNYVFISNFETATISNTGNNTSINVGNYNSIENSGTPVTITGGTNSTISNSNNRVTITAGNYSSISSSGSTVSVGATNYSTISISDGSNFSIYSASYCSISNKAASAFIGSNSFGNSSAINYCSINNSGANISIRANNCDIINSGAAASICCYEACSVNTTGSYASISNIGYAQTAITLGGSSQYISATYQGNITITGYKQGDTLSTSGVYFNSSTSGKDLYVNVAKSKTSTNKESHFLLKDIFDDSGNRPKVYIMSGQSGITV